LEQALLKVLPKLEIYNSKVTEKYGQWAIAFCAGILGVEQPMGSSNGDHMLSDVTTLDLSDRHLQVLLPNVFNADELPSLTSLNLQGNLFKDETPASLLRTLKSLVTLQSLQVTFAHFYSHALKFDTGVPPPF
jgi:tubulin--tyrosine ligase-like protein 12